MFSPCVTSNTALTNIILQKTSRHKNSQFFTLHCLPCFAVAALQCCNAVVLASLQCRNSNVAGAIAYFEAIHQTFGTGGAKAVLGLPITTFAYVPDSVFSRDTLTLPLSASHYLCFLSPASPRIHNTIQTRGSYPDVPHACVRQQSFGKRTQRLLESPVQGIKLQQGYSLTPGNFESCRSRIRA